MKKKKVNKKKIQEAIDAAFERSIQLGYITREEVEKYKKEKKKKELEKEKKEKTFKSKTSKYYKALKSSGLLN